MMLNNEIIVLNDFFATTSTVKFSICCSAAYMNCMLLALYHELQEPQDFVRQNITRRNTDPSTSGSTDTPLRPYSMSRNHTAHTKGCESERERREQAFTPII